MASFAVSGVVMLRTISIIAATSLAAALLFTACGDDDDSPPASTTTSGATSQGGIPARLTTVSIQDNKFSPGALQVPVGATVTWDWTGSKARHSVKGTFDGTPVESPILSGTGVFLFAFPKAGIFEYECGIHGASMKGVVTIQ